MAEAIWQEIKRTAPVAGYGAASCFASFVGVDAVRHGSVYGALLGLVMAIDWGLHAWRFAFKAL